MSVRALWIVNLLPEVYGEVQFKRYFPTVERRACELQGDDYVDLPSDEVVTSSLLFMLGLSNNSKQFVEWRDNVFHQMHLPVISVKEGNKELWPVLILRQNTSLLCCLTLIEENNKDSLINMPAISVGFEVLIGILNFFGPSSMPKKKLSERYVELQNYLTLSMPFGTPSDCDPLYIVQFYNSSPSLHQKQLVWGQVTNRGRPCITIGIHEYIRGVQSGPQNLNSITDLYGCVTVYVDHHNPINDVNIAIEYLDIVKIQLHSFILHPCIQTFSVSAGPCVSKRLWFNPPAYKFTLCFYSSLWPRPPFQGLFKMKGEMSVELLIKLKLSDSIQNSFEYFYVSIPLLHRGQVASHEFKPSQGNLTLSDDKYTLKWIIGSRFISSSLEATLTAKVTFEQRTASSRSDSFCTDKDYVMVYFKQRDTNLSGCHIDPKLVKVSPNQKVKVCIEKNFQSIDYRLWNTASDVPFSSVTEHDWPEELVSSAE